MNQPTIENPAFPARLSGKFSLFISLLFFLVLLVGGTSLYFARSIFLAAQEVRNESALIDLVDRIHYTIHHLIEELDRAVFGVTGMSEARRQASFDQIRDQLRSYREKSGVMRRELAQLWEVIRELDDNSEEILKQVNRSPSKPPGRESLRSISGIAMRIQPLAHALSATHRSRMEEMERQSSGKMQIIVWLYGSFIVAGSCLLLVSGFFFSRSVSRPLRALADGAREIAQGSLAKKVPVRSKDEIGQLSYAFNVMVDRLKAKEQELHGMATLDERERIAQELHDTLAQDLVFLQMKLNEAEKAVSGNDDGTVVKALDESRDIAESAYENVRQSIFGLRTMVSKSLGLIPTLTEYLHDFSEMRKFPVALKVSKAELFRFAPHVEVQLIRIIHEALTNVVKHAEAHAGVVRFDRDGDLARISIEDDGKGFAPEETKNHTLSFGLKTMRERAEGVGGRLAVESVPGKGTKVVVTLPIEKGDGDETDPRLAGR